MSNEREGFGQQATGNRPFSPCGFAALEPYILVLILGATAVWGYFVCIRDKAFGVFDQADMALVASNLIKGNGFYTEAIWVWVTDWGNLHHPEDFWPLLQPIVTAGFFAVFGTGVAAQKAVGVLFLLLLLVATYYVAKRLFGPWQGALAALLLLPNGRIPDVLAYGLNDIGAAFLFLAAMYAIHISFDENTRSRPLIIAAVLTGFAIHQKFQGVMLPIAYFLRELFYLWKAPRKTIARLAIFFAVLIAVGSPLMIRNYKIFGQLSYPANSLINSLGSSSFASAPRWRRQMVFYKLYWEHEKPSRQYLLEYRGWKYLFIARPANEILRVGKLFINGVIVGLPVLILGILGVVASWKSHRPWIKWNGLVVLSSLSFALFRGTEPRYYLFMVPMAAIMASYFVSWLFSRIGKHSRILAAASLAGIIAISFYTEKKEYKDSVVQDEGQRKREANFLDMCAWLNRNLGEDEGAMSWNAGEVAFHSGRSAGTIPNINLADLVVFADRYKLRYLMLNWSNYYLNWFQQPGAQHWVLRQLAPLYEGKEVYGFKLVYKNEDIFLYRIPRPDEINLEKLPRLPPEPDDFTILLLPPELGGLREAPPPLEYKTQQGLH